MATTPEEPSQAEKGGGVRPPKGSLKETPPEQDDALNSVSSDGEGSVASVASSASGQSETASRDDDPNDNVEVVQGDEVDVRVFDDDVSSATYSHGQIEGMVLALLDASLSTASRIRASKLSSLLVDQRGPSVDGYDDALRSASTVTALDATDPPTVPVIRAKMLSVTKDNSETRDGAQDDALVVQGLSGTAVGGGRAWEGREGIERDGSDDSLSVQNFAKDFEREQKDLEIRATREFINRVNAVIKSGEPYTETNARLWHLWNPVIHSTWGDRAGNNTGGNDGEGGQGPDQQGGFTGKNVDVYRLSTDTEAVTEDRLSSEGGKGCLDSRKDAAVRLVGQQVRSYASDGVDEDVVRYKTYAGDLIAESGRMLLGDAYGRVTIGKGAAIETASFDPLAYLRRLKSSRPGTRVTLTGAGVLRHLTLRDGRDDDAERASRRGVVTLNDGLEATITIDDQGAVNETLRVRLSGIEDALSSGFFVHPEDEEGKGREDDAMSGSSAGRVFRFDPVQLCLWPPAYRVVVTLSRVVANTSDEDAYRRVVARCAPSIADRVLALLHHLGPGGAPRELWRHLTNVRNAELLTKARVARTWDASSASMLAELFRRNIRFAEEKEGEEDQVSRGRGDDSTSVLAAYDELLPFQSYDRGAVAFLLSLERDLERNFRPYALRWAKKKQRMEGGAPASVSAKEGKEKHDSARARANSARDAFRTCLPLPMEQLSREGWDAPLPSPPGQASTAACFSAMETGQNVLSAHIYSAISIGAFGTGYVINRVARGTPASTAELRMRAREEIDRQTREVVSEMTRVDHDKALRDIAADIRATWARTWLMRSGPPKKRALIWPAYQSPAFEAVNDIEESHAFESNNMRLSREDLGHYAPMRSPSAAPLDEDDKAAEALVLSMPGVGAAEGEEQVTLYPMESKKGDRSKKIRGLVKDGSSGSGFPDDEDALDQVARATGLTGRWALSEDERRRMRAIVKIRNPPEKAAHDVYVQVQTLRARRRDIQAKFSSRLKAAGSEGYEAFEERLIRRIRSDVQRKHVRGSLLTVGALVYLRLKSIPSKPYPEASVASGEGEEGRDPLENVVRIVADLNAASSSPTPSSALPPKKGPASSYDSRDGFVSDVSGTDVSREAAVLTEMLSSNLETGVVQAMADRTDFVAPVEESEPWSGFRPVIPRKDRSRVDARALDSSRGLKAIKVVNDVTNGESRLLVAKNRVPKKRNACCMSVVTPDLNAKDFYGDALKRALSSAATSSDKGGYAWRFGSAFEGTPSRIQAVNTSRLYSVSDALEIDLFPVAYRGLRVTLLGYPETAATTSSSSQGYETHNEDSGVSKFLSLNPVHTSKTTKTSASWEAAKKISSSSSVEHLAEVAEKMGDMLGVTRSMWFSGSGDALSGSHQRYPRRPAEEDEGASSGVRTTLWHALLDKSVSVSRFLKTKSHLRKTRTSQTGNDDGDIDHAAAFFPFDADADEALYDDLEISRTTLVSFVKCAVRPALNVLLFAASSSSSFDDADAAGVAEKETKEETDEGREAQLHVRSESVAGGGSKRTVPTSLDGRIDGLIAVKEDIARVEPRHLLDSLRLAINDALNLYTYKIDDLDVAVCFTDIRQRALASYVSTVLVGYVFASVLNALKTAGDGEPMVAHLSERISSALMHELSRRHRFEARDSGLDTRLFAQREVVKQDVFKWYQMMTPDERTLVREIKRLGGNPTADDLQALFGLGSRLSSMGTAGDPLQTRAWERDGEDERGKGDDSFVLDDGGLESAAKGMTDEDADELPGAYFE